MSNTLRAKLLGLRAKLSGSVAGTKIGDLPRHQMMSKASLKTTWLYKKVDGCTFFWNIETKSCDKINRIYEANKF